MKLLCDLAHLLFADCQVLHFFSRVNVDMQILEQFFGVLDHFFVVDAESFFRLPSDENILSNGKVATIFSS